MLGEESVWRDMSILIEKTEQQFKYGCWDFGRLITR
jgi:hypothetical protein